MAAWLNRLAYSLWTRNDRLRPKTLLDAFRTVDAEELLSGCPKIPRGVREEDRDLEAWRRRPGADSRVPAGCHPALRLRDLAGRGSEGGEVRSVVVAPRRARRQSGSPPGVWEVLCGEPTTGSMLEVLSESVDGGQVLLESFAATELDSVLRNRNNCYWKIGPIYSQGARALSPRRLLFGLLDMARSLSSLQQTLRGVPGNARCVGASSAAC